MIRLALVGLLLAAGCTSEPPMTDPPTPPPDDGRTTFLALGDSYTIGEGVPASDRWPSQLADALRQSGYDVATPTVIARTGWTTGELDEALDGRAPGTYDLVTLLIGVNDQYRGLSLDGYRERYRALLARAVASAGGDPSRVVAVSFPDWGVTPFGGRARRSRAEIAAEVDAFNAAARQEAEAANVAWVDVTALSRTQGDLVVSDGLHPNAAAYAAWTERIQPAAQAALAD